MDKKIKRAVIIFYIVVFIIPIVATLFAIFLAILRELFFINLLSLQTQYELEEIARIIIQYVYLFFLAPVSILGLFSGLIMYISKNDKIIELRKIVFINSSLLLFISFIGTLVMTFLVNFLGGLWPVGPVDF